jgi:DNA-binding GntR family transcriptional regulator
MTLPRNRIQPDSYLPLRLQAYTVLREAIVSGRLKPGERVVEDRVCGELGISRSPLREALRRLEGEGLVTILPRRGVVVTELSMRDGTDLFAVREALEGLAARLAARHITSEQLGRLREICQAMEARIAAGELGQLAELNTEFHEHIVEASHNRWIREFLMATRAQIRLVYSSSLEILDRAPGSLAEHRLIVDALAQHDAERAERMAREHVLKALEAAIAAGLASPEGWPPCL